VKRRGQPRVVASGIGDAMAMTARIDRTTFAGGEIGRHLHGRTDTARYQISVEAMENYVVMLEGGATRTPGTRYVLPLKMPSERGRLVPYRRNSSDYYMLVINGGNARFVRQGGFLQNPDTTPYEMSVPWNAADLASLRTASDGPTIYAVNGTKPPQEITRAGLLDWSCADFVARGGPVGTKNVDLNIRIKSSSAFPDADVVLTGTGGPFLSGHVGGIFRLDDPDLSTVANWTSGEEGILAGGLRRWKGNVYQSVNGGTAGPNPPEHTEGDVSSGGGFIIWRYLHSGYGFVRVTAVTDANTAAGKVLTRLPAGVATGNGTYRFWPPEWSDAEGYPTIIAFYTPRLLFGRDSLLWLSATDDVHDFGVTGEDDGAIAVRLRSPDGSLVEVKWALPSGPMVVGSSDIEWVLRGPGVFDALTASNIRPVPESNEGSAEQTAIMIDGGPLFVGKTGKRLHYAKFDRQQQTFDPDEISVYARSLFGSKVVAMAWQRDPHRVCWIVLEDGALLTMTYMPKQQVLAFARQPRVNAFFEDVGVIPSTSVGEDEVYFIVRRTIGGQETRYVEQLSRYFEPASADPPTALGAWFLDCAVYYEGAPIKTVTSLAHLEGQTVGVFADGAMQSLKVVAGGKITLDREARTLLIGIPVRGRIKDLPRNFKTQAGDTDGERKTAHEALVYLQDCAGGTISVNGGEPEPLVETGRKKSGSPIALFSGKKRPLVDGDIEDEAQLEIVNDDAMPCTVLQMSPVVDVEEDA